MSLINKHFCSNQQAKQFDFLPIVLVSRNVVPTFILQIKHLQSLYKLCQLKKVKDGKEKCTQAILSILIANPDSQKIYSKKISSIFLYIAVPIFCSF